MTHPEQARQSWRVTEAILSAFDLIRSGLGFYMSTLESSPGFAKGFIHSSDGARKSSKSDNLFANILNLILKERKRNNERFNLL